MTSPDASRLEKPTKALSWVAVKELNLSCCDRDVYQIIGFLVFGNLYQVPQQQPNKPKTLLNPKSLSGGSCSPGIPHALLSDPPACSPHCNSSRQVSESDPEIGTPALHKSRDSRWGKVGPKLGLYSPYIYIYMYTHTPHSYLYFLSRLSVQLRRPSRDSLSREVVVGGHMIIGLVGGPCLETPETFKRPLGTSGACLGPVWGLFGACLGRIGAHWGFWGLGVPVEGAPIQPY